jgi:hypothetical protein
MSVHLPVIYRSVWPCALCAVIIYSSSRSGVSGEILVWLPYYDKIAHFLLFGLIATLIFRIQGTPSTGLRWTLLSISSTTLFGVSDECHQFLRPDRFFEIADILADFFGSIVAITTYRIWSSYRKVLEYNLWERIIRRKGDL